MNAIGSFIVKPLNDKLYDNERTVNNTTYLVDTNIESHKSTNRFAEVISTPAGYKGDVNPGDRVVVHHNVFRKVNDIRGKEVYSSGLLKDNYYLADDVEVYAYNSGKEWKSIAPYTFIKPILSDDKLYDTSEESMQYGEVFMGNDELSEFGVGEGDKIYFQPDSEYRFDIEGVKLYRMKTNSICLKKI